MKKVYRENLLGKYALLWAMDCAFDLNRGCGTNNLWENDIRFEFDGHKCRVLSIDKVDNDTWGDDVEDFIKCKCADWFDSYD